MIHVTYCALTTGLAINKFFKQDGSTAAAEKNIVQKVLRDDAMNRK